MATASAIIHDSDITELTSKAEFYELCIDQLKKDVTKYLASNSDISKSSLSLVKAFKTAGSSESNSKLRAALFLYAENLELLQIDRKVYAKCESKTETLLLEGRKYLLQPLKDVIEDASSARKKNHMIDLQYKQHMEKLNENPSKTLDVKTQQQTIALSTDRITTTSAVSLINSSLPIHYKLFEVNRVKSMKKLLKTIVTAELRYHCRAVESLSAVLQSINLIDDEPVVELQVFNKQ